MERTPGCDAELHAAWQAGDSRAAAQLIVRHRARICQFGERLGLTTDEAEDLAHQVLLEAHRSPFESRAGVTYFSWLARIARRQTARLYQRKLRQPELLIRQPTSPRTGAWRSQLVQRIESMPDPLADVFARLAAGYTATEIGRELAIPPSTVRTLVQRGRQWLRAQEP